MPVNFNEQGHTLVNNQKIYQDRAIRESECRQLTGLARTTRYQLEKAGKFPQRRKLGGRSIGWMLSEVQYWIANQPKVSRNTATGR
ncbi:MULTISPECIES: helix-turn-helix transcriptional regulator [Hafnia]|uniref:Predicted transcriptional regulator n=2 Tax=Hafnia alvei TaxID=569 RepID=A0A377PQE4_HAFAL|nr:AlpA family phage regulatory protein [Hafnia alvei]MDN5449935.1 AlpA family phage regulatory protein [Enterobacterales bacterium]KFC91061.1 hypothetical protein GHAL_0059 [Hafnia alvei ATCC 13337]MDN6018653.1 AlpA family phage regulatory protein [Enterobacterales bacterium]RLR09252.1 AlpA family phage regulatory protein [Hafnia alvei ATCC 13337]WQD24912.1 AlpA family phage regulatory protein [Hafnia alvei]